MLSRPVLRTLLAAGLVTGLIALAACGKDDPTTTSTAAPSSSDTPSASASPSGSASATPSATASVKPSTNLDAITVTGAYGKKPDVKIAETPWAIDETQSKVLSEGKGGKITEDMTVEVNYYGVDGRTGKVFDESFTRGQSIAFPLNGVIAGFKKGLVGKTQGSRVLIAMPGKDGYDASGGTPDGSIKVGDSLIFVVDVVAIPLSGPEGAKVAPKDGLPTVSGSVSDPKITVPKSKAPTSQQAELLIKGSGKKVTAADTITTHYQMVDYATGKVLGSDYGKAASQNTVSSLPTGFQKALVGQTVGSRVLTVIPPADAFPNGSDDPKVDPDTTVVLLIDVLFTNTPATG